MLRHAGGFASEFFDDFVDATVKLGNIHVLTGAVKHVMVLARSTSMSVGVRRHILYAAFLASLYYFPCLFVVGTQRVVMLCFILRIMVELHKPLY